MNKRRSLFVTGILLSALVLFGSTTAQAQDVTVTSVVATDYGNVRVSWNALEAGQNAEGYKVRYEEVTDADATGVGTSSSVAFTGIGDVIEDIGDETRTTLTGLKFGQAYLIGVVGYDEDDENLAAWGVGSASRFSVLTLDPEVPEAPDDLVLTAMDGAIMAMWDEVSDPVGIHHYKVNVEADGFSLTMRADMNEALIENLMNGTEYTVTVQAAATCYDGDACTDRVSKASAKMKATPTDGATPTPALPLFGAFALGAGLLAAGRRRLRRRQELLNS